MNRILSLASVPVLMAAGVTGQSAKIEKPEAAPAAAVQAAPAVTAAPPVPARVRARPASAPEPVAAGLAAAADEMAGLKDELQAAAEAVRAAGVDTELKAALEAQTAGVREQVKAAVEAYEMARLAPLPMVPELQQPPVPPEPPEIAVFAGPMKGSYLGVGVTEVDAAAAKELKLKDEHGVKVTRVSEGSPAEKAGIKENDVILEFNGQRVEGVEQFVRMVREVPAGRTVKLLIARGGQTTTLTATVGDRKAVSREWELQFRRDMEKLQNELRGRRFEFRMPDMPQIYTAWRSRLGIEAESLPPQLAEFFGVKKGVLVRSVTKDSAADKAGMKAGDVIVKVDGEDVDSPNDITARLRKIEGTKGIPFTVVRNKTEMALQVVVEGGERPPAAREFGPRRIRALPVPPPPPQAAPAPPPQPAPRFVAAPKSM